MDDCSSGWWKGRIGRLLETGPIQATRRWAEKTSARLDANEDPEVVLRQEEWTLDTQIKLFGIDGGPTANARSRVAKQLERMDRIAEARVLREEVVAAYRRNKGADDALTVGHEELLALNLMKSGLSTEARPLVTHICDVRTRMLGPDHEVTKRAQQLLAVIDQG